MKTNCIRGRWTTIAGGAAVSLLLGACGTKVASVTHGADSGPGSLRAALMDASDDPAVTRIRIEPGVRRVGLERAATFRGSQRLTIEGGGATVTPATRGSHDLLVATGGGGLAVRNLNFRDSSGSAMVVTIPADASGTVPVFLSDVTVAGSGLFGLLVNDVDSSRASIDLQIASSTFSGNGEADGVTDIDAVRVNETGEGGIVATIRQCTLDGNGGDGVELDESGTGTVELRVRSSQFNGNGAQDLEDPEDGLDIDEAGEGDVFVLLEGIRTDHNADEGIDFDEEGAGDVEVRIVRADARGNRSDAISIGEDGDGDLRVEIVRSTATGNGGAGVKVREKDSGSGVLRIRQTVLEGNREGRIDEKGVEVLER